MATLDLENEIRKETGETAVAGLDEAGRGALAGPVAAAAVILPLDDVLRLNTLVEVDDSKKLSAAKRESLYDLVIEHALAYGIGFASARFIDEFGIIAATKEAMMVALAKLEVAPQILLIDGRIRLPQVELPQQSIIHGDSKSLSIAAASILAKVARDRLMVELDRSNPAYGFARHKGYGTAVHCEAISRLGPMNEHRLTFAPLRETLV